MKACSHKTNSGFTPLVFTVRYHCQFPLSVPHSTLFVYIDFHIDILTALQIQIKMFFVPFNLSNWTSVKILLVLGSKKERSLESFFLNWLSFRRTVPSIHQSIDSQTSENRDNLKRVKSFSTPQRTPLNFVAAGISKAFSRLTRNTNCPIWKIMVKGQSKFEKNEQKEK